MTLKVALRLIRLMAFARRYSSFVLEGPGLGLAILMAFLSPLHTGEKLWPKSPAHLVPKVPVQRFPPGGQPENARLKSQEDQFQAYQL